MHRAQYFKIFEMQYRNVGMIFVSFECKKNLIESLVRKSFSRNQTRIIFRNLGEEILLCYFVLSYDIIFIIFFEGLLFVTDGRILFHDLLHVDIQKGTLLTIKIGMHFVITYTMHLLHLIIMKRKSEVSRATKTR